MEKTTFPNSWNQAQAQAQARKLSAERGVPHDFYHVGDGWRIIPVAPREIKILRSDGAPDENVNAVLAVLENENADWLKLSRMTGLSLRDAMAAAIVLQRRDPRFTIEVCRGGGAASIRKIGRL